jgi:hypothetical protein
VINDICQQLGITRSTYYKRLERGWKPEDMKLTRYERREVIKPPRVVKPRVAKDSVYRKSWDSWPMTQEQREINRVLRGWR